MEQTDVPKGEPSEKIVRQPVPPEALHCEKDATPGITKGGDPAVTVQTTVNQQVAGSAKRKHRKGTASISITDSAAQAPGGQGGQEPLPEDPDDADAPRPSEALNFPFQIPTEDNPQKRRVLVRKQLDALVLALQAELLATLEARKSMTWTDRELSRASVVDMTKVLATLQDQREAHRLIERYFEEILRNPSAGNHLPAMAAFKKVAGAMAAVTKAVKGDGREQANKGKSKADALLAGLDDSPQAAAQ